MKKLLNLDDKILVNVLCKKKERKTSRKKNAYCHYLTQHLCDSVAFPRIYICCYLKNSLFQTGTNPMQWLTLSEFLPTVFRVVKRYLEDISLENTAISYLANRLLF